VEAALDPAAPEGTPGLASALRLENLSKNFGGDRALDSVTFTVSHHEVHGLLAQNGSGKLTLIKILSGSMSLTRAHGFESMGASFC
jgi:ABC-type sugar transport system ATPase subunit